jgi:hypothetical protein
MLYYFHVELVNFVAGSCMKVRFYFYFALAMLFPFNVLVNCFLLMKL